MHHGFSVLFAARNCCGSLQAQSARTFLFGVSCANARYPSKSNSITEDNHATSHHFLLIGAFIGFVFSTVGTLLVLKDKGYKDLECVPKRPAESKNHLINELANLYLCNRLERQRSGCSINGMLANVTFSDGKTQIYDIHAIMADCVAEGAETPGEGLLNEVCRAIIKRKK